MVMGYCPNCGKRSEDQYANFCGYCRADMKSLGEPVVSATFTPKVYAPKTSSPAKPVRTASMLRNKNRPPDPDFEEVSSADDGVNVQHFDPDILDGGIEIEINERPDVIGEKMQFRLEPNK